MQPLGIHNLKTEYFCHPKQKSLSVAPLYPTHGLGSINIFSVSVDLRLRTFFINAVVQYMLRHVQRSHWVVLDVSDDSEIFASFILCYFSRLGSGLFCG